MHCIILINGKPKPESVAVLITTNKTILIILQFNITHIFLLLTISFPIYRFHFKMVGDLGQGFYGKVATNSYSNVVLRSQRPDDWPAGKRKDNAS
jgi:hypothetical protein